MQAVAVGCEAARCVEASLAARNDVESTTSEHAAEHLGAPVGKQIAGRESLAYDQAERYRRIEVSTRNVSYGVSHRKHGKSESESHAHETDTEAREGSGQHSATASTEN